MKISADNSYGVVMYKNGESGSDIWIKQSELPEEAGIDCILISKNNKLVLDREATQKVQSELINMINRVLEEQNRIMEAQRVEGHKYKFIEQSNNAVVLIDTTDYTGECFEEFYFPNGLLDKAKKGDIFKFENGEYQIN